MNSPAQLAIPAFGCLGIIWGSNFIYMKMAAELLSPQQIVFFRVLFGFLPVLAYAFFGNALRRDHLRHAAHFFVMGMMATTIYYYCFAKGTALLLSGVAGAVSGAIPLFSFILAVIILEDEKGTLQQAVGIFAGFLGVLVMARPSGGVFQFTNLEGVMYMAVGSLSVGASFVYAKKYIIPLNIPAAALTTYQLGCGLLVSALLTDYQGMNAIFINTHAAIGLVAGLGLLGTGLAYIIYYYIVEKLGAITASSVTYIPPVTALLIGAFIVGEPISIIDWAATALIFLGVLLVKKGG